MTAIDGRVQTTHTGSLPRPDWLGADGEPDSSAVARAVSEVVRRQVEIGIDVVADGDVGKPSYATYPVDRLAGLGDPQELGSPGGRADREDFPTYRADQGLGGPARMPRVLPVCVGPLSYTGQALLERQLDDLASASREAGAGRAFVTAASPGVIARWIRNRFYAGESEYLQALGEAMKEEYDTIVAAGFDLQLDCPDLTIGWHARDGDLAAHRRRVAERLEIIDHATRDIAPERLRLHVCWGNYEGPHHHDIPLGHLLDLLVDARPGALSFEAANPRHEHEWEIFEDQAIPDDQILIPGVIDSTTNYIEHPRLVAQRIGRYVRAVGAHRVIASTDCGFATWGTSASVHPEIAWAKLAVLVEGAQLAAAPEASRLSEGAVLN